MKVVLFTNNLTYIYLHVHKNEKENPCYLSNQETNILLQETYNCPFQKANIVRCHSELVTREPTHCYSQVMALLVSNIKIENNKYFLSISKLLPVSLVTLCFLY